MSKDNGVIDYSKNVNTGYIEEPYNEKDHVLGGTTVGGLQIFKPEAPKIFDNTYGWLDVIGGNRGESQANAHFDSFLCTIHGVGGAITDYLKKVYNVDIDISECIQGVLAGVTPGVGGTIRNSLESFRNQGWAEEKLRAFNASTTQAQCFAVVTQAIKEICKKQLEDYDIYWDVISMSDDVSHKLITESLKFSEVIVAGYAWASYLGNEGVFYSYNNRANHCFRIGAGGVMTDEIKAKFNGRQVDWNTVDLIAIDSYRFDWRNDPENDHTNVNDFLKPLAKDYIISSAYRVYVVKKKDDLLLNLINMLKGLVWFHPDLGGDASVWITKETKDKGKMRKKVEVTPDNQSMWEAIFSVIDRNFGVKKVGWGELSQYKEVERF